MKKSEPHTVADDFCLFFRHPSAVATMKVLLKARLTQFGLSIAEEKTHVTNMGVRENDETRGRRQMTFLGFTIYQSKNRNQTTRKTVFQTQGQRFSRAKAAMKEKILRMRHWPIEQQMKVINASLRGHFNYYGIAGNASKLHEFWNLTRREWKHSLSNRSQNGRVNWVSFKALLVKHPMVSPTIRLSYPQLPAYVRL